jgi:hypothetical protein
MFVATNVFGDEGVIGWVGVFYYLQFYVRFGLENPLDKRQIMEDI